MTASLRAESIAGLLSALRDRRPMILSMGNSRSKSVPATIRALGAQVVRNSSGDVGGIITGVDVLLVSPAGADTVDRRRMDDVVAAARDRGMPVVIDLTGVLHLRRSLSPIKRMIAAAAWPVISATHDEFTAVANPTAKSTDAVRLAADLLQSRGLVAVRGSLGLVTDGIRSVEIRRWDRWLETANAAGRLSAASIAAFLAVAHLADFITAAAAALECMGEAALRAGQGKTQSMESRVIRELAALSLRQPVN